ncbi:MAG TPA: protease modulator HflC [Kiloniellaceae bacterium]|nr:protease modulator HflC [Kiloniellaceae bacterium]
MNRRWLLILGVAVIVIGLIVKGAAFTVYETEQVIVMQFGEPKEVYTEPGLHWKIPIVQDLARYDKRVLNLDPPVEKLLLADQKRLLVDSFSRYRIANPLLFFQTVRTEGTVRQRLGGIVNASLREVLGTTTLATMLSDEREGLLERIVEIVNRQAKSLGIEIVDIRIRRADLPDEVSQQVYDRMKSEREREAKEFRAQGFEVAQRIKASADREATVIKAEAQRESEILRGQGEGERTRILNGAFGKDPDFFSFYRSMQAYEASLADDSTYMVLSPESDFFKFFEDSQGKALGKALGQTTN